MFLNREQLFKLTDKRQKAAQVRELCAMKVPHFVRSDGSPVVVEAEITRAHQAEQTEIEPDKEKPWSGLECSPLEWFESNFDCFKFNQSEIIEGSLPYPDGLPLDKSGVYFLLFDGRLQYVGMSLSMGIRMEQHVVSGKVFDSFWSISNIPTIFIESVETYYIHRFAPPLNVKYLPASKFISNQILIDSGEKTAR